MENDQSPFLSSTQPTEIIEGDITSPSNPNSSSTLDEPVLETIRRMYIFVFSKIKKISYIFKVILMLFFENSVMHLFHVNQQHF